MTPSDARALVARLGLEPLPVEGILFRQTWRHEVDGAVVGTAIIGAVTDDPDSFSAMHRLTEAEVWHFYAGDPLALLLLHPDGTATEPTLGPDVLGGQLPQLVVPAGTWMGASLVEGGTFALFGATMAPGFTSAMFTAGDRDELCARWPRHARRITRLTRPDSPRSMPDGL